jgi:hypothetical protein
MAPSAQTAGGRRIRRWTRETIIEKIREWEARYGEPPCSADWNPSLARWRAQEWRIERYQEGVWPSTNAVKRPFGGSFDAAVRAAGFVPARPGPRRAAGAARPAVDQRAPLAPRESGDDVARLAEARLAALERRLAAAERRAERAEAQVADARRRARRANEQAGRARRARERSRVTERELRTSTTEEIERTAIDAEARVRATTDQAEAATRDAAEARRAARSSEARAAEAEARAEAAERLEAVARAELASEGAGAAQAAAKAAERRAANAERTARELATLVCGEPRRLRPDELDTLRVGGPSGPAVLARALKELGRARAVGNGELVAALTEVASAAIRWRDRL